MWSSKLPRAKNPLKTMLLFLTISSPLLLSGCIQPLYNSQNADNVVKKMKQIQVEPLPELLGHYIGTELIFLLNGSGDVVAPVYTLTVIPRETNTAQVIDSLTGRADSASVFVTAEFKLTLIIGGKLVASGQVTSAAPYDRSSQRFANLRAARDGEIRVAKSLAQDIRNRIAATFATGAGL